MNLLMIAFLLHSPVSHAAFCGPDGFLHGWTGPMQIPCNGQAPVPHSKITWEWGLSPPATGASMPVALSPP